MSLARRLSLRSWLSIGTVVVSGVVALELDLSLLSTPVTSGVDVLPLLQALLSVASLLNVFRVRGIVGLQSWEDSTDKVFGLRLRRCACAG